jgi:hypothetical protein
MDLEEGSEALEILGVKVIGLKPMSQTELKSKEKRHGKDNPEYYLSEIIEEINSMYKETGEWPYEIGVIDTATELESWCEWDATWNYMKTPIGKSFNRYDHNHAKAGEVMPKSQWQSVLTLPNGAGYLYLRLSFKHWMDQVNSVFPSLIVTAHLKEKIVEKFGKEVVADDLDLTGKVKNILCSKADAIGYMFWNKENNVEISFKSKASASGGRYPHLIDTSYVIGEYDKESKSFSNIHWDKIFLN